MLTATQPVFRKGDIVLHEYKEVTVERVEDDRVRGLDFGYGTLGGYDLKCYPVTEYGKDIAEQFTTKYDTLNAMAPAGVNWPSISDRAGDMFEAVMDAHYAGDENLAESKLAEAMFFFESMTSKLTNALALEVNGVPLFRRPRT
jgi:hypothetical protein